jgi:hypothetical protein
VLRRKHCHDRYNHEYIKPFAFLAVEPWHWEKEEAEAKS